MQVNIPKAFTREHHEVFTIYLTDSRLLRSAEWQTVYQAIDVLEQAEIVYPSGR